MDHSYARSSEPWEVTDGHVYLMRELAPKYPQVRPCGKRNQELWRGPNATLLALSHKYLVVPDKHGRDNSGAMTVWTSRRNHSLGAW